MNKASKNRSDSQDATAAVDGHAAAGQEDDGEGEDTREPLDEESETEESEDERRPDPEVAEHQRVMKMLHDGTLAEVNRRDAQTRKAGVFNQRHDYYKKTRCSTVAQEQQSAIPAGVINRCFDESDEEDYIGDQPEIAKEMDALREVHRVELSYPPWKPRESIF